ncbi:hypothetical protein MITS9504_00064 [Synechococcus sp. MIT S9504]|nr:hypothetical protein MITS9504_00064 [Synechococcus sp. MIT S9504]
MASKIKLDETCKTNECLLEFHHDDHLSLDVSFGILSPAALLPAEFMPTWWDLYVERCDQLVPSQSFFETIDTNNASPKYKKRNTSFSCALPDYHYLEFDFLENSIRLGGVFQRLDSLKNEVPPQMLNEILDYCLILQEKGNRTSECEQMLKDIFECLGCPFWIGLMIGRGDMIKLVFKSSVSLENIQPSFLQWFSSDFQVSFKNAIECLYALEQTGVRCCLDLCLSKPSNHPRLCFEIFPANHVKESTSWSVLNSLQSSFNLKEDLILQICNLYNDLPRGVKKTPFSHIFPCPQLPFNTIAAIFSHYKICLEKDKPLQLKTYAHVVAEL